MVSDRFEGFVSRTLIASGAWTSNEKYGLKSYWVCLRRDSACRNVVMKGGPQFILFVEEFGMILVTLSKLAYDSQRLD